MRIFIALVMAVAGSNLWAVPKITFRDSYLRYAATHDLTRLFVQKFPQGNWASIAHCGGLNNRNRAALGDPNPMNGEMTYRTTSAAYAQLLTHCLLDGIERDFEAAAGKENERLFGKEAIALLNQLGLGGVLADPKSAKWENLSEEVRYKITLFQVQNLIGPGVIPDEAALVQSLVKAAAPLSNVLDGIKRTALFIAMQDEFVTF